MQEEYMKGLEIAERFYIQYGAPMIHERFPEYKFYIRRRQYIPAWDTVLIAVK